MCAIQTDTGYKMRCFCGSGLPAAIKRLSVPIAAGRPLPHIIAAMLASSLSLSGCYSTGGHTPDLTRFPESVPSGLSDFNKEEKTDKAGKGKEALPVAKRLALSDAGASRLYSFKAMEQSLRVSLSQFAEANRLNMILDQDVKGVVNVEFHDVTLEQALDSILDPMGLGWVLDDGMIRITREITKTYQVDYLRAARTGSTSMSSNSSGSNTTGSNNISKTDSINFWAELETEIKSLLSKPNDPAQTETTTSTTTTGVDKTVAVASRPIQQIEGRVTINRMSGTVQVTASPRRLKAVDAYMQNLLKGINRQVYIEARILDVTLSDDSALGIDWTAVATGAGLTMSLGTANTITNAAMVGGIAVQPSTLLIPSSNPLNTSTNVPNVGFGTTKPITPNSMIKSITGAITALEQQGTVRVVSQPKVRTLNNQPAIMKVGTDRTFYTPTTTNDTPATANSPFIPGKTTYTPTQVTEGVTLSVTPQISGDGLITLDVMPVVNKIIGIDSSQDLKAQAPQIETKQTTTLIRMKDGETAVIGGLIQEEDAEAGRNVPGLGNAPGVGWLFKGKYSNKVRKELVIFITPHLIDN